LVFPVEGFRRVALGEEEVAVQAREIAVDALSRDDGVDALDGLGMALRRQARAFAPVQLLDLEIAVVVHVRQMPGAHLRHAARDRAVVEHRHRLPRLGEQVGGRHSGDARADDANVDIDVLIEWQRTGQDRGRRPDGLVAVHRAWTLASRALFLLARNAPAGYGIRPTKLTLSSSA